MRRTWRSGGLVASVAALLLGAANGSRPPLVAVARLVPGPYAVTLPDKLGVLEAGSHRVLAFEIPGRLEWIAPKGEAVEARREIGRLDAAVLRTQLRQAELRLRDARADLVRIAGLKNSQATSAKAYEDAKTTVDLRRAEREGVLRQLERKTLRAPFAGVIAETFADPGEVVAAGTPIATLMDLETLELSVGIPGYQIGQVREGALAIVTVPALPAERFEGTVTRVAPAAAAGRHLFEVEIRVPNREGRLRPGMSARAAIVTRTLPKVVRAPLETIVERGGRRSVFVVEEGHARALDVADAPLHGDHVLIPVEAPTVDLVVRGQHALQDGAPVRVDNTVLGAATEAQTP